MLICLQKNVLFSYSKIMNEQAYSNVLPANVSLFHHETVTNHTAQRVGAIYIILHLRQKIWIPFEYNLKRKK